MIFIKCFCIFINLSDLHLQLHLCDIDDPVVSHVLLEQSGHCLHADRPLVPWYNKKVIKHNKLDDSVNGSGVTQHFKYIVKSIKHNAQR